MNQYLKKEIEMLTTQIKEITAIYQYAAKKHGVTYSEFCILYSLIIMDEEYSQKDICDIWSFPKQTVNTVVSLLIKKDYASLENEEGTGNRKIIKLTTKGKEYGEKMVKEVFEAEEKALSRMTAEERKICIDFVTKYTKNLKAAIYK